MPLTRAKSDSIDSGAITSDKIAAGAVTAAKVAEGVGGGPKIAGLDYPGDDTAAIPAGGQTIIINGTGFASGCAVFIDSVAVGVVSFVSSSQLQFIAPAKATGLYTMYVVNPDGGTAILVPGMVYSGTPTWTTASGSIGTPYETTAVSINLAATGDGALSYAVTAGSSLPTGLSLSSAGAITGTVPATANDTTYTFNVDVIDSENQSTTRQFSVTYKVDVVTWSSPAAGASFAWAEGSANSTTLTAASAAGKSISFSVQSGSLPANVTIAGNLITGTPTTIQANTAVTVRATAATTNRFADQILYFTVAAGNPNLGLFGGGQSSGNTNVIDYVTISTLGNATDFGDLTFARQYLSSCASSVRGLFGGGTSGTYGILNVIDYVTIATAGNATDFGDLNTALWSLESCSSATRGIFGGGTSANNASTVWSQIDYVTIASLGNAVNFGSLATSRQNLAACSSPTRGVFAGGASGSWSLVFDSIDYVTIASTGNATNFGNLTLPRMYLASCSSSTRGLFAGGWSSSAKQSIIDYVTIASTGNATNFGNLTQGITELTGCSSSTRGLFGGGNTNTKTSAISYVTIASTGNAANFGDMTLVRDSLSACSSNHGGLQ